MECSTVMDFPFEQLRAIYCRLPGAGHV